MQSKAFAREGLHLSRSAPFNFPESMPGLHRGWYQNSIHRLYLSSTKDTQSHPITSSARWRNQASAPSLGQGPPPLKNKKGGDVGSHGNPQALPERNFPVAKTKPARAKPRACPLPCPSYDTTLCSANQPVKVLRHPMTQPVPPPPVTILYNQPSQ